MTDKMTDSELRHHLTAIRSNQVQIMAALAIAVPPMRSKLMAAAEEEMANIKELILGNRTQSDTI